MRPRPAGRLTLFAVNRSLDQRMELDVDLRAFTDLAVDQWITMRHDDLKAVNTAARSGTVVPATGGTASVTGNRLRAVLEPASWNVICLHRRDG